MRREYHKDYYAKLKHRRKIKSLLDIDTPIVRKQISEEQIKMEYKTKAVMDFYFGK